MQDVDKLNYEYLAEKAEDEIQSGQVYEGLWAVAWWQRLKNAQENDAQFIEQINKLYWNENSIEDFPKKIVIASASKRKAIQIATALIGFIPTRNLPFMVLPYDPAKAETPLELNWMMEEHISNGDGVLTEVIELGEYFGVPVFMCPSDGETSSNEDPIDQSRKKIDDIKEQYADEDVIIIASDTVGQAIGVDNKPIKGKLGKPVNLSKDETPLSPDDPEFANWYRNHNWRGSDGKPKEMVHLNGLVALRLHQAVEVELLTEFRLQTPTDEELDKIKVLLETGAGGLTQQLIKWDQPILDQLPDGPLKQGLAHFPEERHAILLFNHIIGVPAWALPALFRTVVVQQKHVTPVQYQ